MSQTAKTEFAHNEAGPVFVREPANNKISVPGYQTSDSTSPAAIVSPCLACQHRNSCVKPCEELESMLPSLYAGQHRGPVMGNDQIDHIVPVVRITDAMLWAKFEKKWHRLTRQQRRVVECVVRKEMTFREAGAALGRSPSAACEAYHRALAVLEGRPDHANWRVDESRKWDVHH